ncbi:O-antigen ligase family protein [Gordonia sp. C13]|uniref:O-antigen ligase family protein n=1 Tax=Gordonia sp. C13 TaxID=2935078 RepID=UPI00200B014D|nr:O-antigen ligase family protein [Gordonia sp. C13]MCK8616202.1 O-antigen ligase family protein [Gordonia sp. C13]
MTYLLVVFMGVVGFISIAMFRVPVLVALIVLGRAVSDVGHAAGHALFPTGLVSVALSLFAWLVLFLKSPTQLGQLKASSAALALASGGTILVYFYYFGLSAEPVVYLLKLSSLIPIFLLARSVSSTPQSSVRATALLSWSATLPCALLLGGLILLPGLTVGENGRPSGTFVHANAAGSFISIAVVILVWLCLTQSRRFLVPVCVALVALVLTGSLNAVITAVVGVIVLCCWLPTTAVARFAGVILCGLGSWLVVILTPLGGRLEEALASDFSSAIALGVSRNSLEWRFINWSLLLDTWRESPTFGWGIGSTSTVIQPLGGPPHSLSVQLLVETGILGVILTMIFGAICIASFYRNLRIDPRSPYLAIGAAVTVSLLVNGLASNLLSSGAALYLAALLYGICGGLQRSRFVDVRGAVSGQFLPSSFGHNEELATVLGRRTNGDL